MSPFQKYVAEPSAFSQQSHYPSSWESERKCRGDASILTQLLLRLSHHQGLLQSLWILQRHVDPFSIFLHEWYKNNRRLFGPPCMFVCFHICVWVRKPSTKVDQVIFLGVATRVPTAWRHLLGDGILQPLDSLTQEYYYWFWSWATAYWMQRLVFSTANSSSGSYRSALMTSFCKDAFSLLNGRRKCIYLSLSQASSRGERRLPVEIMLDD